MQCLAAKESIMQILKGLQQPAWQPPSIDGGDRVTTLDYVYVRSCFTLHCSVAAAEQQKSQQLSSGGHAQLACTLGNNCMSADVKPEQVTSVTV